MLLTHHKQCISAARRHTQVGAFVTLERLLKTPVQDFFLHKPYLAFAFCLFNLDRFLVNWTFFLTNITFKIIEKSQQTAHSKNLYKSRIQEEIYVICLKYILRR